MFYQKSAVLIYTSNSIYIFIYLLVIYLVQTHSLEASLFRNENESCKTKNTEILDY